MPTASVLIARSGRSDPYGRPLLAGSTYTLDGTYAQSLVNSGFATYAAAASDPSIQNVSGYELWRANVVANEGLVEATGLNVGAQKSLLQAQLDTGFLQLAPEQSFTIDGPLIIPRAGAFINLNGSKILMAGGGNRISPVISTYGAYATPTVVTATSSGTTVTLSWRAHGQAVGDFILVWGFVQDGYCGVFQVVSAPSADTLTYSCAITPSATPATGTGYAVVGTSFAHVVNGGYDQNVLGHSATVQNVKTDPHGMLLVGVYDILLRDLRPERCNKHCVLVQGFGSIFAQNIEMIATATGYGNTCDGIHINGPGNNVFLQDIKGRTSDNLVAMALCNTTEYRISEGSINNATQYNLIGNDTFKEISHGNGFTGRKFGTVSIKGVHGKCGVSAVGFYESAGAGLVGLSIDRIYVEDVDAYATEETTKWDWTGTVGYMYFGRLAKPGSGSGNNTNAIRFLSSTNTVGELVVDGLVSTGNYNTVEITQATIGRLTLTNVVNTYGTASLFGFNQAAGTIDEIVLRNVKDAGAATGRFLRIAGTVNKLTVDGFYGNGTQALLAQSGTANAGMVASFSDVRGSMTNLATFNRTATIAVDPSVTCVCSGDLLTVSGAGNTLTVYGLVGTASTSAKALSSATVPTVSAGVALVAS